MDELEIAALKKLIAFAESEDMCLRERALLETYLESITC